MLTLIVMAIVIMVVPAAISIAVEDSEHKIGRKTFALRTAISLLALASSISLIVIVLGYGQISSIFHYVFGSSIIFFFYRQIVRRARDAGFGKKIAYVAVIPVLNALLIAFLLVKKSARA